MTENRSQPILFFISATIVYAVGFGFLILRIIRNDPAGLYSGSFTLPAFFPSQTHLEAFSLVALIALAISNGFVLSNQVQINRRKNVVINSLIVAGMIFAWYFLLIQSGNLVGALVMVCADFLVSLIVISMLYLVEHRAGYYFIPTLLWSAARIILSIFLVVLN